MLIWQLALTHNLCSLAFSGISMRALSTRHCFPRNRSVATSGIQLQQQCALKAVHVFHMAAPA